MDIKGVFFTGPAPKSSKWMPKSLPKQEYKVSYRCSLPSPLQKPSKDYKGLHWCQNPEDLPWISAPHEPIFFEDLLRFPPGLQQDLKPEREHQEARREPEEIFKEYGFMWGTKPKQVLRWVLETSSKSLKSLPGVNSSTQNAFCTSWVFFVVLTQLQKIGI